MANRTALIKIIKTGTFLYPYRAENLRWSDLESPIFSEAWQVRITAEGKLGWGPFKYRERDKQNYSGTSEAKITTSRLFSLPNNLDGGEYSKLEQYQFLKAEAESYALRKTLELEQRGFRTALEFEDDKSKQSTGDQLIWIRDPPELFIQKRILKGIYKTPGIEELF